VDYVRDDRPFGGRAPPQRVITPRAMSNKALMRFTSPSRPPWAGPTAISTRGGPWGYAELLEAIDDPTHERHADLG
jgi:hypothetical protein